MESLGSQGSLAIPDSLGAWDTIAVLAASRMGKTPVPFISRSQVDLRRAASLTPGGYVADRVGDTLKVRTWRSTEGGEGRAFGGRPIGCSQKELAHIDHEHGPLRRTYAYVLSTSGSTGRPKHVPIGESNLRAYASHIRSAYQVSGRDVVAQVYRPHFDAYYNALLLCLAGGATLAVAEPGEAMLVSDFVNRYHVTVWDSVPSLIRLARRAGKLPARSIESVRLAFFGGEPLRRDDFESWRAAASRSAVVNAYGPSEMTITMCEYRVNPDEIPVTDRGFVAIGRPIGDTVIRLRPWSNDREFELLARGSQRFDGYLDHRGNPPCFVDDHDRPIRGAAVASAWYSTGDIVAVRDGQLCYRGRSDRRIQKVLGQRFDAEEVESIIEQDPRVARAFVHVVGDRVVAVVERAHESARDDLEPDCSALRPYAKPRHFFWVTAFPLVASGKADAAALRDLAEEFVKNV